MKVLLINGSPHESGCTYTALAEVAGVLEKARLQMQCYVTTVDFEYQQDKYGKVYGWGVARYATPEQHFGDAFTQAVYLRTPEESRDRLIEHLRSLFPSAEAKQLSRILGGE